MTRLFTKYISILLAIYLLSYAIDTIAIDEIPALLLMGLVLLFVNLLLKPLLLLLALPFSIITLGLFNFVINAWTIMLADHFVSGIRMGGFLNSLIAAFFIAILNHVLREISKSSSHNQ